MTATFARMRRMAQPQRVDLVYQLDGDITEVDVFRLAPTLLAFGRLIREGHRELYPDAPPVAVNVRPFRAGTFHVDVSAFEQTRDFLALIPTMGGPDPVGRVLEALKAVGIIKGWANSALEVLKKLRAPVTRAERLPSGEVRYQVEGGITLTVNGPVHQLLVNPAIRGDIAQAYGSAALAEGITGVRSYIETAEEETAVDVRREEAPRIADAVQAAEIVSPRQIQNTIEVFLHPVRGPFDGDPKSQWSFRRGETTLTRVKIRDQGFLEKYHRGDFRLHYSDVLRVRLLERQTVTDSKISTSYEIIEVIDRHPGAQQSRRA